MKQLVFFSGGSGSYEAMRRLQGDGYSSEDIHLLFTDTGIEDKDLYMLLLKSFENLYSVNLELEKVMAERLVEVYEDLDLRLAVLCKIADNVSAKVPNVHWLHYKHLGNFVTPWYIYEQQGFLGNSRIASCSAIIKQRLALEYVKGTFPNKDIEVNFGIDWEESHRMTAPTKHWSPYVASVKFPLNEAPWSTSDERKKRMGDDGVGVPRMYQMGFPHHNCGGFCCRAGQGHFKMLLEEMPKVFDYHADREARLASRLKVETGKNYSIVTKQINKEKVPYTLRQLEADVKGTGKVDKFDIGGCGCFVTDNMSDLDIEKEVKFSVKDLVIYKGFKVIGE